MTKRKKHNYQFYNIRFQDSNTENEIMQLKKAESVTHNYYNSSPKPKFYKNTRLAGKIIEKTSLTNFY